MVREFNCPYHFFLFRNYSISISTIPGFSWFIFGYVCETWCKAKLLETRYLDIARLVRRVEYVLYLRGVFARNLWLDLGALCWRTDRNVYLLH
jgi:hypothetical protein